MLTEVEALRAYARMLNTLSPAHLEPLLADDFTYESQNVFSALESKHAFLDYIQPKLRTVKRAGATVFAEMGVVSAYRSDQPCVVLAQNDRENLVALVFAKVTGDKIVRLDLCIIPPPSSAMRTGEYPA